MPDYGNGFTAGTASLGKGKGTEQEASEGTRKHRDSRPAGKGRKDGGRERPQSKSKTRSRGGRDGGSRRGGDAERRSGGRGQRKSGEAKSTQDRKEAAGAKSEGQSSDSRDGKSARPDRDGQPRSRRGGRRRRGGDRHPRARGNARRRCCEPRECFVDSVSRRDGTRRGPFRVVDTGGSRRRARSGASRAACRRRPAPCPWPPLGSSGCVRRR